MSGRTVTYGSSPWWVRQVSDDLAVELWPGDGAHIRLVASSYPVKVALLEMGPLMEALKGAIEALAEAADSEVDAMGPVIDQEGR